MKQSTVLYSGHKFRIMCVLQLINELPRPTFLEKTNQYALQSFFLLRSLCEQADSRSIFFYKFIPRFECADLIGVVIYIDTSYPLNMNSKVRRCDGISLNYESITHSIYLFFIQVSIFLILQPMSAPFNYSHLVSKFISTLH